VKTKIPDLFHRLFYREHLARLAQRLDLQERTKRSKKLEGLNLTIAQISAMLEDLVRRAEDETLCNDNCKGMYFCDRKKGHKGKHSEGGRLTW
jgi:sugar-specific transcriptional regulator TrmB